MSLPGDDWNDQTLALPNQPAEEPEVGDRDRAYLVVLTGDQLGRMIKVDDAISVGRSPDATLRINDPGVSRIHIVVSDEPNGAIRVTDQRSRNGTFINGQRIDSAILRDGDKVRLGSTAILKFSYADRFDEQFQQHMYTAAVRDQLTGLYNRRHLMQQLDAEFSFARRHDMSLVFAMFDIDHFKRVNDDHGHPVGDAVLVAFAQLLRGNIRTEDLAARYGGEEFSLVCRNISLQTAEMVANRLRSIVADARLVPDIGHLQVTISGGIAAVPNPAIGNVETLIEMADNALYRAKNEGRNRICLATPPE